MNPVATAIVVGALVVGGKWADGKAPTMQNGIGIAGVAVSLAILEQASKRLSTAFAWLILLGTMIVYFPKIARGTGLSK